MVKYIIVAKNMPQMAKDNLIKLGFNLIDSAELKTVHKGLKYHPDMQIVKGDNCYICAPECYDYYKPYFEMLKIKLFKGEKSPGKKYPSDVLYNVAVVGDYAVHNFNYTDKQFINNSNFKQINVKQGYSKCSICVVSETAVITSDEGIANTLVKYDIDVLLVSAGSIDLSPFEYGFIGGASGLVEKNKLAFCGNISLHPEYEAIYNFCKKYNVEIINLSLEKPCDIGTIICIG